MDASELYAAALAEASKVEPDYEEAARLLIQADDLGSREAAKALGSWYFYGVHFPKNVDLAIEKWTSASNRGDVEAAFELGVLFERGENVETDYEVAFQHYLKAAIGGHAKACYELGRFFYYGYFVPENQSICYMLEDLAKAAGYTEPDES